MTEHPASGREVPPGEGRHLYEFRVSCPRCGRSVSRLSASLGSASIEAWEAFLRAVPWDCDASLVESVMGR